MCLYSMWRILNRIFGRSPDQAPGEPARDAPTPGPERSAVGGPSGPVAPRAAAYDSDLWKAPTAWPYARALERLDDTLRNDGEVLEVEIWAAKVYDALGAPFRWHRGRRIWIRFGTWTTRN